MTVVNTPESQSVYPVITSSPSSEKDENENGSTQSLPSTGFGSSLTILSSDFKSETELCKDKDNSSSSSKEQDIEKSKEEKEYTGIKRYGGMILTMIASLSFSFVTLMVKYLQQYGSDQYGSAFWRYMGTLVPAIPIFLFYECGPGGKSMREKGLKENEKEGSIFDPIWPLNKGDNWKTFIGLIGRGLIGSTSVILRYYALQYLTVGDTSVITYSTPVLVTVMAHFCLGEKCGVIPVIVAFTTLLGVIIVAKPPLLTGQKEFEPEALIGTILACASLFCASLIVIITRKIREVHFTLMLTVFGTIGVVQAITMALTLGDGYLYFPKQTEDLLLTIGVAGLSFIGQMAIILALKFEQAGPVALLRSCDVVFGFLLQFIFLGVVPDLYSGVGGIIVFSGVIIIASRKWIKTLPQQNCVRKGFGWVLL